MANGKIRFGKQAGVQIAFVRANKEEAWST